MHVTPVSFITIMAHLLGAENLKLEYPTRVVFDGITLGIAEGDRIGIVGRNGDGKSSLLAMLAGNLAPDAGQVTRRKDISFGILKQDDDLDDELSIGANIVGDTPEHVWAGDARIRDVISGLVSDLDWDTPVKNLSGGERRRIALAQLLTADWDILALDEPTNHLDIEGIAWLASHLKQRWPKGQGALLVVTHDRWFLDEVSETTWEVHNGIVEPFEGGYAAYVLQRVERDRIAAAREQKRQNLMQKELAWLRRGAPARTSKPKFRIAAANALIADVPPLRDSVKLQRLAVNRLGKDVVRIKDAGVSYGDRVILNGITWDIAPGERTGILGANGAGKSTLLGLVAGTISPTSGSVKHGKTVQIAVLDQRFSQLQEIANDRVRDVLARTKFSFEIDGKELTPSQLLERLGFRREQLSTPVADLSGGQKRRLQLLLILLQQPNVLILDEPTNDVDSEMLTALEDLLDSWPGTLIVVSHDRYLLERVTDQQYAIFHGSLRHLPGGIEEYLRLSKQLTSASPATATGGASVQSQRGGSTNTAASQPAAATAAAGGGSAAAGASGSAAADPAPKSQLTGAAEHAARKQLSAIDRKLAKLQLARTEAHKRLAECSPQDYSRLTELSAELDALTAEIDALEEEWLEVSAALEG